MSLVGHSIVVISILFLFKLPLVRGLGAVECSTIAGGCDAGNKFEPALFKAITRFEADKQYGGSDPVVFASALVDGALAEVAYTCENNAIPPPVDGGTIWAGLLQVAQCENLCGTVEISDNCSVGVLIFNGVTSTDPSVIDVVPSGSCCTAPVTDPDTGEIIGYPDPPQPEDLEPPGPIIAEGPLLDVVDDQLDSIEAILGDLQDELDTSLAEDLEDMIDDAISGVNDAIDKAVEGSAIAGLLGGLLGTLTTAGASVGSAIAAGLTTTALESAAAAVAAATASNTDLQNNRDEDEEEDETCQRCGFCTVKKRDLVANISASESLLPRASSSSGRQTSICGANYDIPTYRSWDGKRNQYNVYNPWYGFEFDTPGATNCFKFDYNLVKRTGSAPITYVGAAYATEHVYELQLVDFFFTELTTTNVMVNYLASLPPITRDRTFCQDVFDMIFKPTAPYSDIRFGAGQSMDMAGSRPIDELTQQFSSDDFATELMYLDSKVNGLKAVRMGVKNPRSESGGPFERLALIATVYKYLNDKHVRNTYCCVSGRMRDFYGKLNRAVADGVNSGALPAGLGGLDFLAEYTVYEGGLIRADLPWQTKVQGQYSKALVQLAKVLPSSPAYSKAQALIKKLKISRAAGELSNLQLRWKMSDDMYPDASCDCDPDA